MKRVMLSLLFSAGMVNSVAGTITTTAPRSLSAALAAKNRTGCERLSEGYRGGLRVVARTGVAPTTGSGRQPETLEFTHLNYNDRGIGASCRPAFALMVGSPAHYRFPAIFTKSIPKVEDLRKYQRIEDFAAVFGEMRSMSDGWGLGDGVMHSSCSWAGFSLRPDGSLRVVSVFLYTAHRAESSSIEGMEIREGVFKPTGKTPQLEKP